MLTTTKAPHAQVAHRVTKLVLVCGFLLCVHSFSIMLASARGLWAHLRAHKRLPEAASRVKTFECVWTLASTPYMWFLVIRRYIGTHRTE